MKIYIIGSLKIIGNSTFEKDFSFLPTDVLLSTEDGKIQITLSAEESESSFIRNTSDNPTERRFSCRFRGADATIEKNGKSETIEECSFMHIAELLIEHKMVLHGIEIYSEEDVSFEVSIEQLAIWDGNLLMDLSESLNVKSYKQVFEQ